MTAQIEGADVAVDTATLPQDRTLKLASDLAESARVTDEALSNAQDAVGAIHAAIGNMMAAFKAMAAFVAAENADLKFRLEFPQA